MIVFCRGIAVVALAAAVLAGGQARAMPSYTVTDLGTLSGGTSSSARALNFGTDIEVVGWSSVAGAGTHAFSWTSTSGMQDLGMLGGGTYAQASAVNNAGQAAGWSDDAASRRQAVTWSPIAVVPGATPNAEAFGINNAGQLAGYYTSASGALRAFRYSGAFRDLGTLGGGTAQANGIDDAAEIVGSSTTTKGQRVAFFYDTSMHTLPLPAGGTSSSAAAISAVGTGIQGNNTPGTTAVGNAAISGVTRAVVWRRPSGTTSFTATILPAVSGISNSYALGVNSDGTAVGYGKDSITGIGRALMWQVTGNSYEGFDLSGMCGCTMTEARGVNAGGEIVGTARFVVGGVTQPHAVLLTPPTS